MNLQQKKDNSFLATEPLGKLLLKLSLPTVTAQIINMLYNIVDRIYIGHIPENGALALTGVGVCMPLIMIVSAFAALVGNGGAPRASIFMGKGDKETAERTLGNCFTTQIIVSLLLTIILFTGNRSFLMAFGASENTIPYAVAYMNIYSLGTIFVQLTLGMNAFITAQGFARTGMLSVLVGAASNIILDPVFIFVFHMGVRGAALATIISQALSCAWVLNFLTGKKSYLKIRRCNMKLQKNIILPSLALGLSTFIMQASESIISVCFNSSLLKYGGDLAVGAMTILTSAMQFAMLPLQGLGQGAQPIISYNFGAGQTKRVKDSFKLLLKIDLSVAFSHAVPGWFCFDLYIRPGAFNLYCSCTADLHGFHPAVRHPDGLPDDLYFHWKRKSIYHSRCHQKIYPAAPVDLHHASHFHCRSDVRCLHGRTDCRFSGHLLYKYFVQV